MSPRIALALLLATGCAAEFLPRKPIRLDIEPRPAQVDSAAPPFASVMPTPQVGAPPNIEIAREAKLRNGVRVLLLERHTHPLVAVSVVLQRGSAEAAPGVFDLFVDSMASGSDLIDPEPLHQHLYEYAVEHRVTVSRETSVVSAQFVAPLLHDVVRMVVPAFATPSFEEKELKLLVDQHKRKAAQMRDEPGDRAKRELTRLLFPNGHPYADYVADSDHPLEGVTREAIMALRSYVGADDVAVVAAGDVTLAQLMPLLDDALGSLKPGARARRQLPESPPPSSAHVVLFDHPRDSQAQIALGFAGVPFDSPDYPALWFLSKVLQDETRASVRLTHGTTYATSGEIRMMRTSAPVTLSMAVDVAFADEAIGGTVKAIKNLDAQLARPGELDRLKSWVLSGLTYETVDEVAQSLTTLAAYGLPADHWNKMRLLIGALGADEILKVARTYLDPTRAQLVVLGDAITLRGELESLGLGNVEVRKVAH